MSDTRNIYSIVRLHSFSDYSWGVVDERGALIEIDEKFAFHLTKSAAQKLATDLNSRAHIRRPAKAYADHAWAER